MAHRESPPHAAHDRLLVFGVATAVLGVVLVSQGLLVESAAHWVPRGRAVLLPAERALPAPGEHLAAITSPPDSNPLMPAPRTASSDANTGVATCFPHGVVTCPPLLDFEHDLRLVLGAMAWQQRRTWHPTAHVVRRDKQDIPASTLILANESLATPEASSPAARRSMGPSS
jgi:hypothetical protein